MLRPIAEIPCPVNIQLPRDAGRHPETAADCWYFSSILEKEGRRFGAQAFFILFPPAGPDSPGGRVRLVVTDLHTGVHHEHLGLYAQNEISASDAFLDVRTPTSSLREEQGGEMILSALLPDGTRMDLRGRPTRPVLYNCGSGLFPHMGTLTYQYSIGAVETAGTITFDEATLEVNGWSWFDRQTLAALGAPTVGFNWMGICLSTGETISLWDVEPETNANRSWVTVVHSDGTHTITGVAPLAASGSDFWISPRGRRYASRWDVELPFLDARLKITQVQLHENDTGSYTGVLSVTGSSRGASVTGHGFADLIRVAPAS